MDYFNCLSGALVLLVLLVRNTITAHADVELIVTTLCQLSYPGSSHK